MRSAIDLHSSFIVFLLRLNCNKKNTRSSFSHPTWLSVRVYFYLSFPCSRWVCFFAFAHLLTHFLSWSLNLVIKLCHELFIYAIKRRMMCSLGAINCKHSSNPTPYWRGGAKIQTWINRNSYTNTRIYGCVLVCIMKANRPACMVIRISKNAKQSCIIFFLYFHLLFHSAPYWMVCFWCECGKINSISLGTLVITRSICECIVKQIRHC